MELLKKLEELNGLKEFEQLQRLNHIGSYINFIEDAVKETEDKELMESFKELQQIIMDKRIKLFKTEI